MTIYSDEFRFDVWVIVNDAEHFAIRKREKLSYIREDVGFINREIVSCDSAFSDSKNDSIH